MAKAKARGRRRTPKPTDTTKSSSPPTDGTATTLDTVGMAITTRSRFGPRRLPIRRQHGGQRLKRRRVFRIQSQLRSYHPRHLLRHIDLTALALLKRLPASRAA